MAFQLVILHTCTYLLRPALEVSRTCGKQRHNPAASGAAAIHAISDDSSPAVVAAATNASLAAPTCPTFQQAHLGPLAVEQAWDVGLVVPQRHLQSTVGKLMRMQGSNCGRDGSTRTAHLEAPQQQGHQPA